MSNDHKKDDSQGQPEASGEGKASGAEDKVGYRRPPKRHQFKRGRSGNPAGRRKGIRNIATEVKEMLGAPVQVRNNGKSRSMTTQKAAMLRLRDMALKGDIKALDRLIKLSQSFNDEPPLAQTAALTPMDEFILAAFEAEILERHGIAPLSKASIAQKGKAV